MKVLEKHTVSFSCNQTLIHLMGERNGVHLLKSVAIENPQYGKVEVELGEVDFHSPIRTTKELFNAVTSAIGYWTKNNVMNEEMKKDVRYFARRQWLVTENFDVLVNEFNQTAGRSYHSEECVKIKQKTVHIKIPSTCGNKVMLTFMLTDRGMYSVKLNITNGPLTISLSRNNRRLMNGNALIKQFQDWVHATSFEGHGKVMEESKTDIRNFLFEKKSMLTDLIEDLNCYKDK